ncbi:MAG: GNAT superfamily N-acetyltransferase [Nitrospinales bacterium]|jgi:GNAT superfamily N-acetyltransferase
MPIDIKIREAVKSDIPVLAEFNQALAKETEDMQLNRETLVLGISNALDRDECHYFIAELNGHVVGQTMITYEWSDWRNGIMWWIQSVFVPPEQRGKGVFRALFNHVDELAKKHPDVKALRLYVMQNNFPGKKTYAALGMTNSGYVVYEKEGLN